VDAAVIVIGSKGRTHARKVFDTSVSERVAKHASRPVLIMPPSH